MTTAQVEWIKDARKIGWSGGQWKDREKGIPDHGSTEQSRGVQRSIVPYHSLTNGPDGASQGCWTEDRTAEADSGGRFGMLCLRRDSNSRNKA